MTKRVLSVKKEFSALQNRIKKRKIVLSSSKLTHIGFKVKNLAEEFIISKQEKEKTNFCVETDSDIDEPEEVYEAEAEEDEEEQRQIEKEE